MKEQFSAREILDSRGNPTIEFDILTSKGVARASVPAGASKGTHEAKELRDGGKRFGGLGVLKAIKHAKDLSKKIEHLPFEDREKILVEKKEKIGANTSLALSIAFLKRDALLKNEPIYKYIGALFENKKFTLPIPSMNVINGGKHAGNNLDFQEFMLYPNKAKTFSEAVQINSETYHVLKAHILKKYGKTATNVGDEGGFAPPIADSEDALNILVDSINDAGYKNKISIALDAAASEFYKNGRYYCDGMEMSWVDLADKYKELCKHYPLVSIEDPFQQEDFKSFNMITKSLKNVQIVGDDLLTTNPERISKALVEEACNALLLKVNQIGTISESLLSAGLCQINNWNTMVSHRSGDTEDSFISHLAVGINAKQIKSGAPCRGERTAKYNELLRIEEELGKNAKYGFR